MNSYLEPCRIIDTKNPTDVVWWRAVFDFEELLSALVNDSVDDLVSSVFFSKYGSTPIFSILVRDVVKSLMCLIAATLRKNRETFDAGVLFRSDLCDEMNAAINDSRVKALPNVAHYWIGEGSSES